MDRQALIDFFSLSICTLLLVVVLFLPSCTPSSHHFPVNYGPERNYNISLITESGTVVSLSGNEQLIAQVEQNGTTFPMAINNSSLLNVTINTGKPDKSDFYPAKVFYTQGHNIISTNGQQTKETSPFSGMVVNGIYDADHNFSIETTENFQLDEYLKEEIKKSMDDIQLILNFPTEGMEVGDQFVESKPMSLPLVGLGNANLNILSTYILKKVEKDMAYFDIEQTVEVTNDDKTKDINVHGSGDGKVEYDVKNTVISSFDNDIFIELNLSVNAVLVNSKSNIKTQYRIDVS